GREGRGGGERGGQVGCGRERRGGRGALELVRDGGRPAVRSARGGSVELELEGELTRRLRELAREAGGTLHQALMAGLMGLLWRYTGQRDRSEEHTSELQSLRHLVCRLLLE